uniref:Kinesin-like protein KIF14 n=1 Tax=Phallusia mammillata TaxID=59560 RepID=A0A6F9DG07_9ASCI|nr:kinesin-like protein KIF14 [Phallusia mammillata]
MQKQKLGIAKRKPVGKENHQIAKEDSNKLKTTLNNSASNVAVKSNVRNTTIPKKVARSSTAATFLGKSADGIGSSPKKLGPFENHSQSLQNSAKFSPAKRTSQRTADSPKGRQKCGSNIPCKKLFSVSATKQIISSPSLSSIPSNTVQHMVNKLQVIETGKAVGTTKNVKNVPGVPVPLKHVQSSSPEDFTVSVAVRIRPFNQREKDLDAKLALTVNGNQVLVKDSAGIGHTFLYNYSFWSVDNIHGNFASQKDVYTKLALPLLNASVDGYNTCLFAYGQTGSGKSYTIMGLHEDTGIIPRFCDDLFHKLEDKSALKVNFHIQVSYFEIYNEKIHDLLVSGANCDAGEDVKKQVLKVREHPEAGPYVEGLSRFSVKSYKDVLAWLEVGNRQRATAATGMNDKSSRSHSVFTLTLVQTMTEELEGEIHESSTSSKINLVDLAGSERSSTAATSGQRLKEGASINKSLLTLGKVISALSERSEMVTRRRKRAFVPYRDSTLTWILKESLGGNSRTAMIATVSPADCHLEETLSTLRYAKQAGNIVNLVKINEDPNARLIRELKAEVAKLKEASKQHEINPEKLKASLQEVAFLRQQLSTAEEEKEEVQKQWKKKLELSEKHKTEEINELKRAGVSFKVDNQLPNLVNLNEDPQLSELLLYMIKHGSTRVGKKGSKCDIQLNGALVADFHCTILNKNEVVSVSPNVDATVYVNGELIDSTVILHHGDRVIIGGDHFFRFNNPIELKSHGSKRISADGPKDFEFAKHEFIERQNERMAQEIEAAQLRVKQEMLNEIDAAKREAEQQILSQKNQYEAQLNHLQTQLVLDEKAKKELEVIREEKQVLEKEVIVTRKNREKEAKIFANHDKNNLKSEQIKTQVLADLEAERQKLSKEVERMQQKSKTLGAKRSLKTEESPLRLSLLLKEANNISTTLNQNTVFSHHDVGNVHTGTHIRVQNTKLNIWTLWSLNKFEEKLESMRDMYNRGNVDDDDIAGVFHDPNSDWQETFCLSPHETPTSSSTSRRLTRRLSSLVLARASPALQKSLTRLNEESSSLGQKQGTIDSSFITSICKRRIEASTKSLESSFESEVDKLLLALEVLRNHAQMIETNFDENDDFFRKPLFHENTITLAIQMEMIVFCVGCLKHHCLAMDSTSSSVARLLRQLDKAMKKLSVYITKMLHGCQSDVESLVHDSASKINNLTPNISKYLGALAIATDMRVSIFNEENQHKLGHRIKHAFLQGGDTFMKKIVSGAVDKLHQNNIEKGSMPTLLQKLRMTVINLLQKCAKLQNEIYESSLVLQEQDVPPPYYSEYLRQIRTVIEEVGTLVSGVSLLDTGDFHESSDQLDLRYRAEMLWRPISRIADIFEKHFKANVRGNVEYSYNSNNNNSEANISDCETANRLVCEINLGARQAHEAVRSIIVFTNAPQHEGEKEDENCNKVKRSPHEARVLPTSPDLLENKSFSSSFAIKHTVAKWLILADYTRTESNQSISNDSVYV